MKRWRVFLDKTRRLLKRIVPFLVVGVLAVVLTILFYGFPLLPIPLAAYQSGNAYAIPPIGYASSLNIPSLVDEYELHFSYQPTAQGSCLLLTGSQNYAFLIVLVPKDSPLIPEMKSEFGPLSCVPYWERGSLPTSTIPALSYLSSGSGIQFCVLAGTENDITFKGDQPIGFDAEAQVGSTDSLCPSDSHGMVHINSLAAVDIFATPTWKAWLLNLLAVFVVVLFIASSVIALWGVTTSE